MRLPGASSQLASCAVSAISTALPRALGVAAGGAVLLAHPAAVARKAVPASLRKARRVSRLLLVCCGARQCCFCLVDCFICFPCVPERRGSVRLSQACPVISGFR